MPVCELFFSLVNSRRRARFDSSSFFWRGGRLSERGGLAFVQSDNGIVGVTETTAIGKNLLDRRSEPAVLRAKLECGVPVPFFSPIRRGGAGTVRGSIVAWAEGKWGLAGASPPSPSRLRDKGQWRLSLTRARLFTR